MSHNGPLNPPIPMTTLPRPLSCGGRGPCCHIGYRHRRCDHCDVVIDTRTARDFVPAPQPWQPYIAPHSQPWTISYGALTSSASPDRIPLPEHVCR